MRGDALAVSSAGARAILRMPLAYAGQSLFPETIAVSEQGDQWVI
jgi:hypothetical protein